MIFLFMRDGALRDDLEKSLKELEVDVRVCDTADHSGVSLLYESWVGGVVSDDQVDGMPQPAWLDILSSVGRRVPVFVVTPSVYENQNANISEIDSPEVIVDSPDVEGGGEIELYRADTFTRIVKAGAKEIIGMLEMTGAIQTGVRRGKRKIPVYNHQIPGTMIKEYGWLSVLVIDASPFRKIRMEFGSEIYYRVQECFEQILVDLWGRPGSFRGGDVLCRRSPTSNTFYIFLERARSGSGMPIPGALERLCDRLVAQLQNALWRDLLFDRRKRGIPTGMTSIPDFSVGHSSGIMNPVMDPVEFTEGLLDMAIDSCRMQMSRIVTMRKEFLLSVMHAPDLLYPHYQGVFELGGITKEMVESSASRRDIRPLQHLLYGFESLIRVRKDWIGIVLSAEEKPFLEAKYLSPDVLFSMADASDVAVELDQACMRQATTHALRLPGYLFVNIFPRNLYHIERLDHLLLRKDKLIFEVAESEAISNIDLMRRIRAQLKKVDIKVAVDDLGKGYAGLERIIRINPDLIKFDRSLIENIHKEKSKQAFVKGLLEAAKIGGATVLAEGVELWEEAKVLQDLGVDLIQGYLLHRPASLEDVLRSMDLDESKVKMPILKAAS